MNSRAAGRAARLAGALAACLLALTGCLGYRCGSIMHPQVKTIAVGQFANSTEESRLGGMLRSTLAEHFMTDGSLKVTDKARADAVIRGNIRHYKIREIAATKKRSDNARDRDGDAYQAAVFRAELEVEFVVVVPGRKQPLVGSRTETVVADFSHLPDLNVARTEGLDRAVNEVAKRMVAAVTEAW